MIKYMLLIVSLFALNGCAFMFNGGKQEVSFETNPKDADIRNGGKFIGTGTAVTSVDRNTPQNIVVSAPGYDDSHVYLPKKMNAAWMFWDIGTCVIPITLCIPVLVDAISGAWNGYEDHYAVKLVKSGDRPPPQVLPQPTVTHTQPASGQQIIIVK